MPHLPETLRRHSRRRFISAAAAGVGLSAVGPAFGQDRKDGPLTGPYDFSNPYDWLAAYAKIRGRLDGGVGMFHYVSHVYGVPDGQGAQLMFRREGVSQHRMTIRDDRTIDLQYVECNYTQNAVTGAVIDDLYDNPFTGKLVPVRHQPPVPGPLVRINPTGGFNPDIEWEPPAAFVNPVGPPLFGEGRIFFNNDILMYRPGSSEPLPSGNPRAGDLQLTELITFSANTNDVQNPELMSAKSFAFIAADVPWLGWLEMGDVPGHLFMRYLAEKTNSIEDIPNWLKRRIGEDHPDFFTEPGI